MKAMGVTVAEISLLIAAKIVLINLIASLAGGVVGVGAVLLFSTYGIDLSALTSHNQYFVVSGVIFPRLNSYSLILPPFLALCFGLLAAAWPVILVARKKAVDVLRSV